MAWNHSTRERLGRAGQPDFGSESSSFVRAQLSSFLLRGMSTVYSTGKPTPAQWRGVDEVFKSCSK